MGSGLGTVLPAMRPSDLARSQQELAQLDVAHIEEVLEIHLEDLWGAGHHRGGAGNLAKQAGTLNHHQAGQIHRRWMSAQSS